MTGTKVHADGNASPGTGAQETASTGKSTACHCNCHCHCHGNPETTSNGKPRENFNKYATKKSLTSGLLDIGLLIANASQFKTVLDEGADGYDLFYPILILIGISIALQVTIGISLLVLGNLNVEQKENQHVVRLNDVTVLFATAVTVLNSLIGSFGINK